jgi:hypothetical protein
MEYTDQYVYVNVIGTATSVRGLNVVLNYSTDRVPYALVEVISLTLKSASISNDTYVLKTEEIAQNYLGTDNVGSCLATAVFNANMAAGHVSYYLTGFGTKLMYANPRSLTLYLLDQAGTRVPIGSGDDVKSFIAVIKVSYPKVGEITPMYRTQIPL